MGQEQAFCFPVKVLQNKRVKLAPFSANLHAAKLYELNHGHPEMYVHSGRGPYDSVEHFIESFLQSGSYANHDIFTYAIIDKTKPGSPEDSEGELAGMISYTAADAENYSCEIGSVETAPGFQGRGIATDAAGLLLQYALDTPRNDGSASDGLGLCRVEWLSCSRNNASMKTAERLGFSKMGLFKYHLLLEQGGPKGKLGNGRERPPRSKPGDLWMDHVLYSITWDEWRDGVREKVLQQLYRD